MEFKFTEEQEMIRDTADAFLAEVSTSAAVRSAMETELGYDLQLWSRITQDMFWQAIHIPEQYGGLGLGYVELVATLEQMGAEADVIISITSSQNPILRDAHVQGGTHIACMGTDTKGKQEVEAELVAKATVFTDEVAQAISIGECQHAIAAGMIEESAINELGAVINGTHPGRTSADEITLFDGTGVGLQDLAVAARVVELAIAKGVAVEVDF